MIDPTKLETKLADMWCDETVTLSLVSVCELIENAPTIDAEPVKHGRWKHSEYAGIDYYQCRLCGHSIRIRAENYCPNCGARMDGDDGDC